MTSIMAWLAKSRKPGMLDKVMSCISPSPIASPLCTCSFVSTFSAVSTVSIDPTTSRRHFTLVSYGHASSIKRLFAPVVTPKQENKKHAVHYDRRRRTIFNECVSKFQEYNICSSRTRGTQECKSFQQNTARARLSRNKKPSMPHALLDR